MPSWSQGRSSLSPFCCRSWTRHSVLRWRALRPIPNRRGGTRKKVQNLLPCPQSYGFLFVYWKHGKEAHLNFIFIAFINGVWCWAAFPQLFISSCLRGTVALGKAPSHWQSPVQTWHSVGSARRPRDISLRPETVTLLTPASGNHLYPLSHLYTLMNITRCPTEITHYRNHHVQKQLCRSNPTRSLARRWNFCHF